ncbi:HalOD1 output domain-containing protein [Salinibaculum salinum]|uniref:HalOD1 output domain-containing protein n=1 Tax=Salinibaculum salinum TaxID=3131996 RepID=UPI0030EB4E7C
MAHENSSLTDEMHGESEQHVVNWTNSESPTASVLKAVAAVTNRSLVGLKPLYDVIDPDVLNQLCDSGQEASTCRVSFRFEGCDVTVHGDGRTVVSPSANCEL